MLRQDGSILGQYFVSPLRASEKRGCVVDPDQGLIERIVRGDEAAFRMLLDRHLDRISAYARRMLRDPSEADDVAQEVFLRAWTQAHRWSPGQAKYETWLHRVAHNLCIDRLRRRRPVPIEDIAEPIDPSANADDLILERQRAERVNSAIDRLPPGQKAAIALCHSQGLGNIEAAKILGVSVEALESLLSRGRRNLREMLRRDIDAVLDRTGPR